MYNLSLIPTLCFIRYCYNDIITTYQNIIIYSVSDDCSDNTSVYVYKVR